MSYYYDIFSGKRILREMIEMTMIESSSSIEADFSMLNSSDTFADGAEGTLLHRLQRYIANEMFIAIHRSHDEQYNHK